MLTLNGIGTAIKNAIRDSAEVRAECQSLFSTNHSTFYGSTGRKGPQQEDFPAFTVVPLEKDRSADEGTTERAFTFSVFLQLQDESVSESVTGDGVKDVVFRGPKSVEDLLDLAMAAIDTAITELNWDWKTTAVETVERFPVCAGELSLTGTFPILNDQFEPTI